MKKFLLLALAVSFCGISTANAQVDVFFSTSSTDAFEGNVLNLMDGGSGSLYVWVDNNDGSGNPVDGIDLDILGTADPMVVANAFTIENPEVIPMTGLVRWDGVSENPELNSPAGTLVNDANAVVLNVGTLFGFQNGSGPQLHGTLDLSVFGTGTSDLTFALGQFGISVQGQAADVNFGSAQVVSTGGAVPEPSALALVGAMFVGVSLRRRRNA